MKAGGRVGKKLIGMYHETGKLRKAGGREEGGEEAETRVGRRKADGAQWDDQEFLQGSMGTA